MVMLANVVIECVFIKRVTCNSMKFDQWALSQVANIFLYMYDGRTCSEMLYVLGLNNSKPGLQSMTSGQISSGLDLTYAPSTITTQQPTEGELDLLFEAMYDDFIGGQPSAA
uniref:Integrase, catalytic region, zinc finger, CCHC-type, peptidase aspartic, catalytic n=1 Tax=Tanacetum cinerariifolium TaxID=118510 RepID=A0A6L2NHC9_TANCI|nr:hypothetical protein [Tanacetum cinerariifolium]